MDDARALLDSLMGPSRDKKASEQVKDEWKEKNVCKRFLVGFCPNSSQDNWFHNTRRDIGTCNKVHSDALKTDFEKADDHTKYRAEYERDYLNFLEGLVREADAWITRERGNCAPAGKITRLPPGMKQKLIDMQEQSEELLGTAEDLAEKGEVGQSKEAVEKSSRLKEDIKDLKEKHSFMSGGEQVCEVCGVRCNPDEAADYQAHLDGKLHEAYKRIRKTVNELREKVRSEPAIKKDDKDRDRSKDKDRDRDRKKDDRGRDREGVEKMDDRDRRKARDRSKEKDREKEKDGSKEKDRDRARDRSRDRGGRDRGGGGRDRDRTRR